ncbi:hypothetical protein E4T48_01507 [Aureobasidium sp. EXF-10727]|nr:hypothetical protein E4T48_01507 [Aureobasidium sp. EXF-10727]
MPRRQKPIYRCLSPTSDPGNHGSDPSNSLQVAPFQSEGNTIWIGYHNQPSKKYLGVFPSFDEVVDRCRHNVSAGRSNTSFPRHRTTVSDDNSMRSEHPDPESYARHVCCIACQDEQTDCDSLVLEIVPVKTGLSGRKKKVFLLAYKFYLRGEQMLALVHHWNGGKYFFQKTDGTLSNSVALDTKHGCNHMSAESDDESTTSSLTQFDCPEDERLTDARTSPRVSLQSSQGYQLRGPATTTASPSLQTQIQPQKLPTQPRTRGFVVIDMTDEDETSPVKQEHTQHPEHTVAAIPYKTPSATPTTTSSVASNEDISFSHHSSSDPLAVEYGRITTQIFQEYSMRVFALPEVTNFIQRMKQAVKAGDRPALCRAYGDLQAFLITVE